jgi:hypothetical protein
MAEEIKRELPPPNFNKNIDKDTVWIQCPRCKRKFSDLMRSGVCLDCETEIDAEKRREKKRENKERLLDKVKEQAVKETKFRADIDG